MDKAAEPHTSPFADTKRSDVTAPGAFRLSDFHYDLPAELIAQAPLANRSDSRLMVVNAADEAIGGPAGSTGANLSHHEVTELPSLLRAGDHLVFNDTRVIPARLFGVKASGGRLELMLERVMADNRVLAKVRASKSPKPGSMIVLHGRSSGQAARSPEAATVTLQARVIARHDDLFELEGIDGSLADFIEAQGEIPLPPYIERKPDMSDQERYQTVYADTPGAVAAPTAGLHFDEALFEQLAGAGITHSFITLHVGAGTFQPVRVENPAEHVMHAERVTVGEDTVEAIRQAQQRGGRVIAVGTTCVRALESAANQSGKPAGVLAPFSGETRLFLTPGSHFHVVDGLFTNFHLPESTLLMLVSAFAGLATTMAAYSEAVRERYRFFSYGDAMLVWPQSGVRV